MTYVFPFIVGSPRSGTTLLRAMFDSHSMLAIPPESYFIVGLQHQFANSDHRLDRDQFLSALAHHERFQLWGIHEDEVAAALGRRQPATYADAIRTVYQLYAQRVGKPRFGDKTPRYSIDIPLLAALFQEAVFVHIIRDGRDVALSLMDVRLGQGHVREAALLWRDRVEAARGSGAVLGPRRYREIRYEALIDEPESALESLCAFVQLDFEPGMLDYFERVKEMPDPALGVRYRPRHHTRLVLPPTKGLRDWRTQMSPRDLAVFEANAGDLLFALGYERGIAHIPLRTSIGQKANDIAATARSSMGAAARRLVTHNS
jgi:Sulfotransferase family